MARLLDQAEALHSTLREQILAGSLKVGEKLLTTNEMAKSFGCSVGLAGKVIAMLVHEGLVEQRRGLGTRVLRTTLPSTSTANATMVALDAFAFIYASEKHEAMWRTVRGFQDAAHDLSRRVLTLSTGTDYVKEAAHFRRLADFGVRGAAIYPIVTSLEEQIQFARILATSTFPIVLVDWNLPRLECPAVVVDGFHAGYVMTQHFLRQGLRRVGFFANQSSSPSVAERYRGYRWALEEAGLPVDMGAVLLEPTMTPNYDDPLREPTALAREYLKRPGTPEGVVCSNDFLARGLIRAAAENGIDVPSRLKVSGMDDLAPGDDDALGLTTYRVPFEEMGRAALATLQALVERKPLPEAEIRVRGQIVRRQSA